MSTVTVATYAPAASRPAVAQVAATRPLTWLRLGSRDMLRQWPASLALGALFAGAGFVLTRQAWEHAHLALFFTSGFLLVAPFLALGFYALSRRAEQPGHQLRKSGILGNLDSVGMYAVLLAFVLSAWERISAILVALFIDASLPRDGTFSLGMLLSPQNLDFLLSWVVIGGILAVAVFVLSVVTLPLLMDREIDVVTAMGTSLRATLANPVPMLVWATLTAGLVFLGEALWFVGLAVILPILGHATWHAYRDLVVRD